MKTIQNRGMGVLLVKRAEDGSDVWGFLVELLRQRLQQHLCTQFRYYCQHKLVNLIITKSNWIDWTSMKRVAFFLSPPPTPPCPTESAAPPGPPAQSCLHTPAHPKLLKLNQILNILNHLKMNAKLNQQICFQNADPNHMSAWLTVDCAKWIPRDGKECCVGHSAFTVSDIYIYICPSAGGKGRRERGRG